MIDRIQLNALLIILGFAAVLGLSSQSAASYPSYLLALSMLLSIRWWKEVFRAPYVWVIAALLFYLCLSSLWSDPFGVREFVGICIRALLVFCFVIAMAEAELRGLVQLWLGRLLAIVGSVAASISYYFHLAESPDGARLAGVGQLDNPVVAGLVFGAVLIIVLEVLLCDPRRAWRVVAFVATVVLLFIVVMTESRNAWGSLTAGILVLLCAIRIDDKRQFLAVLAVLMVLGLAALAGILSSEQTASLLFPKGDSYRLDIWQTVLAGLSSSEWMIGRGVLTPDQILVEGHLLSHSHSMYLTALVQGGLIALVLLVLVMSGAFAVLFSAYELRSAKLAMSVLTMATISYLFDGHEIIDKVGETWFLLWLPVGIALGIGWNRMFGDHFSEGAGA